MRRVPQEAFLSTARIFRTGKACFCAPSAFEGVGKGSAGDEFRVSWRKELVEGVGANKESEVLSEASCAMLFTLPRGGFVPNAYPGSGTRYYKKKKVNCES